MHYKQLTDLSRDAGDALVVYLIKYHIIPLTGVIFTPL